METEIGRSIQQGKDIEVKNRNRDRINGEGDMEQRLSETARKGEVR